MSVLPDNILKLMRPEDRAALGKAGLTASEAIERAEWKLEEELAQLVINYLGLYGIPRDCIMRARPDKAATINRGWTDLTFLARRSCYEWVPCGWELKTTTGTVSKIQHDTHAALKANGWQIAIIRSVDDARNELARLGITKD